MSFAPLVGFGMIPCHHQLAQEEGSHDGFVARAWGTGRACPSLPRSLCCLATAFWVVPVRGDRVAPAARVEPGQCTMSIPPPRYLATPPPRHQTASRWPWRLGLVAFGLTTGVLAALVASATLVPQPPPPQRAP